MPQQNEVAERANLIIVEIKNNILHAQNLDKLFWAEAVVNVVYIRNCCRIKALDSITPNETWTGRRPCIAHMHVFECVTYTMVSDEQMIKLDTNDIKCLLLGCYEGIKAYRLMCLQTKNIIKNRDVVFMEDDTGVENALKMRPSERNGGPTTIVVDEYFKLYLCDDGEKRKEQVRDQLVANDGCIERFGNDRIYPKKERPGEWWMNHILP